MIDSEAREQALRAFAALLGRPAFVAVRTGRCGTLDVRDSEPEASRWAVAALW